MVVMAEACSRMEGFERRLRGDFAYRSVSRGVELDQRSGAWRIESQACSAYGDYAADLEVRCVATAAEVARELRAAVSRLLDLGRKCGAAEVPAAAFYA